MLKKKVQIIIPCVYEDYLLKRINRSNITFDKYLVKNDFVHLVIFEKDYELLKKTDYRNVIEIEKCVGIGGVISFTRSNIEIILITLLSIILIYSSNLLVYKVNIISSDVDLKGRLSYDLEDSGLKPVFIKKQYNDLESIKDKLKEKYKDKIEWIEIVPKGGIYNIYLIKRNNKKIVEQYEKCNYVSNKSGTIKNIKVKTGMLNVQENNFVNKGDVLISGDIIYNEEIKSEVCARGKITGEVWYKVNVTYPLTKTKKQVKDSKLNLSVNLMGNRYLIFKNKYDEEEKVLSIGSELLGINLIQNKKYKYIKAKLSIDEATKKAENLAMEKVLKKINNKGSIISQNILKKEIKNGKINLEVLVTVDEELGIVEKIS